MTTMIDFSAQRRAARPGGGSEAGEPDGGDDAGPDRRPSPGRPPSPGRRAPLGRRPPFDPRPPLAPRPPLDLRLGTLDDWKQITYLIDETAQWLATRGTDQWQRPWPDVEARDRRVRVGLAEGRTWTVWDDVKLAATVTLQRTADPALWPDAAEDEAVYPCRLVVDRAYAGLGIGAELMDWAGRSARDGYGARWIRIDVWTTNRALHRYYQRQGFRSKGVATGTDSPAAALFEKPTAAIAPPEDWPFEGPIPVPYKDARVPASRTVPRRS
jgi:GNAT superfamily N-acetyltransferase